MLELLRFGGPLPLKDETFRQPSTPATDTDGPLSLDHTCPPLLPPLCSSHPSRVAIRLSSPPQPSRLLLLLSLSPFLLVSISSSPTISRYSLSIPLAMTASSGSYTLLVLTSSFYSLSLVLPTSNR